MLSRSLAEIWGPKSCLVFFQVRAILRLFKTKTKMVAQPKLRRRINIPEK